MNGKWSCSLFIEGGRVRDTEACKLKTGLKEIAGIHKGDFRLTGNQNVIIANVSKTQKPKIEKHLETFRIIKGLGTSGLRLNSIACVALGSCGLANAESERYLPILITRIEEILKDLNIKDKPIITVLNKIDLVLEKGEDKEKVLDYLSATIPVCENTLMISAQKGWGLEDLLNSISNAIKETTSLFHKNTP